MRAAPRRLTRGIRLSAWSNESDRLQPPHHTLSVRTGSQLRHRTPTRRAPTDRAAPGPRPAEAARHLVPIPGRGRGWQRPFLDAFGTAVARTGGGRSPGQSRQITRRHRCWGGVVGAVVGGGAGDVGGVVTGGEVVVVVPPPVLPLPGTETVPDPEPPLPCEVPPEADWPPCMPVAGECAVVPVPEPPASRWEAEPTDPECADRAWALVPGCGRVTVCVDVCVVRWSAVP